ncbi:MAG: TetR family transcriptional regulator [Pseudomonadota bacterium]
MDAKRLYLKGHWVTELPSETIASATGSARRGPKRDPAKAAAIAAASCTVLTAQGVRLTKVAHIAEAAGIAAGTVYLYASEKAVLVEMALRHAARMDLGAGVGSAALNPDTERFETVSAEAVDTRLVWPVLDRAAEEAPGAVGLETILAEAYDLLAGERILIALLDKCAGEVPVWERLYAEGARRRYLTAFEAAIRRLAGAGLVRSDVDHAAGARAILEMLVWMAMRRPGDTLPPACDEAAAREASLALASAALRPDR